MLANLYTAALLGLECKIVEVEVDYRKGNAYFSIVGLADKSIQEAKDRIPSAIKNSEATYIPMRIIINLAPAELSKSGPAYDLPLALGYLLASDQIVFEPEKKLFIGELALDGRLRPVTGILPITDAVKKLGFEEIFLPKENALEASLVKDIKVYPVETLQSLIDHFNRTNLIEPFSAPPSIPKAKEYSLDISIVKGQAFAKRALEIAASGGHNILLSGVPGSGKTLLSKCLPSILPEMTIEESLEVTRIYSVAGFTSKDKPLINSRPFRSPHHTSSQIALVGGGSFPKPGEISLAHRGVLFLDEFPEFTSQALEALRQPLEDRIVTISRVNATLTFPANFILVAAMNPCKCGFNGDPTKECKCTSTEIARYQKKISGPILDRIDLLVNVPKVETEKLYETKPGETSEQIRKRVQTARDIQIERYKSIGIFCNSELPQKEIDKVIKLDSDSKDLIMSAVNKMNLSARSYFRVLKLARTIADLEGEMEVKKEHIAEALSYRMEIGS